jgi:predicted Zn-dependent peptidase
VWVAVGGRDEPDERAGASHFLEHLLFKGTARRDARTIAVEVDAVGGDMNAFTANEHTAYYARVPATEGSVALDVLLDVVADPALRPADVEGEREVILEELAAAADDPDDVCAVQLFEQLFPGHPLGREVLGSEESIAGLDRDAIAGFFAEWYTATNLVVVASGAVDHDRLVDAVAGAFSSRVPGPAPRRSAPGEDVVALAATERPVDQLHLGLGWRALPATDPDRYALAVLNHVLGAGPSSRLFWEVREERGLTYSISSGVSSHVDAGALTVHCATAPQKATELLAVVDGVVGDLVAHGVDDGELRRARSALRGGLLLGLEDAGSRMVRLGAGETLRGGATPLAEHLGRLEEVTAADVARVAQRVLGGPRALSLVGPAGFGGLAA